MSRRIHRSASGHSPDPVKKSQLSPHSFTIQAKQESHQVPTQEDLENETFQPITNPEVAIRSNVSQAKVDSNVAPTVKGTSFVKIPTTFRTNETGLPDNLKMGIERLSGYSLDDVRVHYNSPKPAQLRALAYTQGTEIHVAPGQEKHLPHESWHAVQQMQGRIKPTMQLKGMQINDDRRLEREADVMGHKAWQIGHADYQSTQQAQCLNATTLPSASTLPIQCIVADDLNSLGLAEILAYIQLSATGKKLMKEADALGVHIVLGRERARTQRLQGSGRIQIQIPIENRDWVDILSNVVFELNNAVRQADFDAASQYAVSGAIADPDQYARAKIRIELNGMLTTGRIGLEMRKAGLEIPVDKMYIPEYLDYLKERNKPHANPSLTRDQYIMDKQDEVLDRRHELGSHREFYTQQFNNWSNSDNNEARERSAFLRSLADHLIAISKSSSLADAIEALQSSEESQHMGALRQWLAEQRDSSYYRELYHTFEAYMGVSPDNDDSMKTLANELQKVEDIEVALKKLHLKTVEKLYSWIEAHDIGQYRNLIQIVGQYLGYYDNSPEQLRWNMYPLQYTFDPELLGDPALGILMQSVMEYQDRNMTDELVQGGVRGITFISGENWTCYVRSILIYLNKLDKYEAVMDELRASGIAINDGVEVGGNSEVQVLNAIASVTGDSVYVTAYSIDNLEHAAQSDVDNVDGRTEVRLLHSGAHFSLLH